MFGLVCWLVRLFHLDAVLLRILMRVCDLDLVVMVSPDTPIYYKFQSGISNYRKWDAVDITVDTLACDHKYMPKS